MNLIGSYAVPLMILVIVLVGVFRVKGLFGVFTDGAKDGLKVVLKIAPSLIGLITAIEMFKTSGALDVLTFALTPIFSFLPIPPEVTPLILLRPISGSGAIALLDRMLELYGPDSSVGRVAAVMCGSSETTFYTTTMYYGSVGVKKIRHTLICALAADFCGVIISSIAVGLLFN